MSPLWENNRVTDISRVSKTLERDRDWCIRSRLACNSVFFCDSFLSPEYTMTKLHIVTPWVRQRDPREAGASPTARRETKFLATVTERGDQESPREGPCGVWIKDWWQCFTYGQLLWKRNFEVCKQTTMWQHRANCFLLKTYKSILYLWVILCKILKLL